MKQPLPSRSATTLLKAAGAGRRFDELAEAERRYQSVLASRPLDFDALRGLGLLLLQQRRSEEALNTLSLATRVDPKHANAWCEFGVAHALLGRIDDAVVCYDRALSLDPRHVEAFGNKGSALAMLKRPLEALACYDKALALKPRVAAALSNRGGLLRELGRLAEALESLDRSLALAPGNPDALNNRGNVLVELGRLEEALASFDKALTANPNCANTYNNRGNALLKLRRAGEALTSYDRSLNLTAPTAETLTNRANALKSLQRHAEALDCFANALALAPHSAPTYQGLANVFLELERPLEALSCYDQAIALDPQYADAIASRASAFIALKRPTEALATCASALALSPGHVDALNNLGAALNALGRESEALPSFEAAIAAAPDFALAHENRGVALLHLGRLQEAAAALEAAIALEPSRASAYHHLSLTRRFQPGERFDSALEALVQDGAPISPQQRVYAHFALGKAFADAANPPRSFHHLAAGNALKRRLVGYDEAATLGFLQRNQLAYGKDLLQRLGGGDSGSPTPVFVFGMPRSGTTLVEQILASHPSVHGAGEIDCFDAAALEIGGETAEALRAPETVWRLRQEDFHRLGDAYLSRLKNRAGSAKSIVNKTTENFRYAGLIALALPQARMVHVRRDPIDTCFSCFSNLFVDDLAYTYDLGELGRYYRTYETLMAHWRAALPPGMMIEVRYEDVVADLEGEGRRILAHCGLDWDPRCLDFHTNERSVRTASVAQVRRPLYASSVGRWRRYEAFLGPLIEALGLCEARSDAPRSCRAA